MKKPMAATANNTILSMAQKVEILEELKNAPSGHRNRIQNKIIKTYNISMKQIREWKSEINKYEKLTNTSILSSTVSAVIKPSEPNLNSTDDATIYMNSKTSTSSTSSKISNKETEEIKEMNSDILKLRKQLNNHKDEISKLRSELKDALKEATTTSAIKKLIHGTNKDFTALPEWLSPCDVNEESLSKNIAYMMFSDIHYSEVVNSDEVNGVNCYNKQISKDRIFYTIDKFIEIMKNDFSRPIEASILSLNGDLISGDIWELLETNEGSVTESIIELSEILIQCIIKLQQEFGKVFVPCTIGNHGRTTSRPKIKRKVFDSYEYILYHIIAKHFRNDKNITITVPDNNELFYSVYGVNILQSHGDTVRAGNSIGGVYVPLFKAFFKKQTQYSSMRKPDIDLWTIGHFHTYSTLTNVLVNGSVVGFSELASQWGFGYEDPQQAVMIINSHKGITYQTSIKCNGYEKINNIKDGIRIL